MNIDEILKTMTPEIYRRFQTAIEIRKWPDGNPVSEAQLETCMQAVIAYEHRYVNETERTGYVPPKDTPCNDKPATKDEKITLKWAGDDK